MSMGVDNVYGEQEGYSGYYGYVRNQLFGGLLNLKSYDQWMSSTREGARSAFLDTGELNIDQLFGGLLNLKSSERGFLPQYDAFPEDEFRQQHKFNLEGLQNQETDLRNQFSFGRENLQSGLLGLVEQSSGLGRGFSGFGQRSTVLRSARQDANRRFGGLLSGLESGLGGLNLRRRQSEFDLSSDIAGSRRSFLEDIYGAGRDILAARNR